MEVEKKDEKSQAVLGYTVSSMPAWDRRPYLQNKHTHTQKKNSYISPDLCRTPSNGKVNFKEHAAIRVVR